MNLMKQKRKLIVLIFLIAVAGTLFLVNPAEAALVRCGTTGTADCQLLDLVRLVMRFINTLLGLSWLVATFFVFWNSWDIVFAWGNPEGIKKGKEGLRQALFGFFFIMVAFILVNFIVFAITGLNIRGQSDANSIFQFFPGL
jgi:ABC-type phosphate transport system permease subunit